MAISAAGQDKVNDWLRLFNWVYASQENYDFCVYGVEGKDYERDENGTITKLVTDNFFDDWFVSCTKYKQFDPSIPEEKVERYKNLDDDAQISKRMGFVFDSNNVTAEAAAITAVYDEYIKPMENGLLDYDENIDMVIEKLKKAGIDTYVEEVQRQFSEFYANNQEQ